MSAWLDPLDKLNVAELRARARASSSRIAGYSSMNKGQLLAALAPVAAEKREDNPLVVQAGPQLSELNVSYSYDIKANLGQGTYESASVHITRGEKWDVRALTKEEADDLYRERYDALKGEVDPLVEEEYKNLSCFALQTGDDK